jgi:hypothetical protein
LQNFKSQRLLIDLATAKANLEALKKFKNFANYLQRIQIYSDTSCYDEFYTFSKEL